MRSTPRHQTRVRVVLTGLLTLVMVACGSGSGASSPTPTAPTSPTTAPAQTTSTTPTTAPQQATWTTEPATTVATTEPTPTTQPAVTRPTVLLVHGAFAGPSSWDGVVPLLEAGGFTVTVVENPLRGPSTDAAAVRAALDQIEGPVVLVGHSYGGVAITNAATGNPNVEALVYIAAYVPDEGDTLAALQAFEPAGAITPDVLILEPYTKPDGTAGLNAHIKPEAFQAVFAGDLSADAAASLAAQQMPIDAAALTEASGVPAWRTIPSWHLVATQDKVIPPEAARRMAQRANATTVEVDASHAVLVSQPATIVDLIGQAVASLG